VEQLLAKARSTEPDDLPQLPTAPLPADALKARAAAGPPSLAGLSPRTPPGPAAKPLQALAAAGPPRVPPAAGALAADPAPFNVSSLIDEDAPWLPPEPERKTAFLHVFRYWHAQVRPENAAKATPAFLFLVTAVPVMVKARDDLKAVNLWEPPGDHSRQARDAHPAWKKYCEFLPRAQHALQALDAYRHLSLLTDLDDLNARIGKAEKRFREGDPAPARPGPRR
jgi:hypothetical protein